MDYEKDLADYEAWERSVRLIKNLIERLGEDAPLSMALGMAQLFEPLRPGSARYDEERERLENEQNA